jgi:cytoskeleton protein RodZ
MTTTIATDLGKEYMHDKPGAQLAEIREQKGYSAEYVAGKLHLRVRIIELLEADDYQSMPEPVFIKGYLRAYAKLLDVLPDPFVENFNRNYSGERKIERALWQGRRQTHKAEHTVRWVTSFLAVAVLIAVMMWWNKNKEAEALFPVTVSQLEVTPNASETEIRLTDLSKMRSVLSSVNQSVSLENPSE